MKFATKPVTRVIVLAFLVLLGCDSAPDAAPASGYEAFGLLGMNREQCRRRWGIPVEKVETEDGGEIREYDSKGFHVQITFAGEKCSAVTFKKLNGEELSAAVIDAVLGHNGEGWQRRPGELNSWSLSDGSMATYVDSTLTIRAPEAKMLPRDESDIQ